jgi:hypothetical protein
LAWGGHAAADDYRPDDFLGLDLSRAVLSPKRLGPPTQFAPVAVEAKSDARPDSKADHASDARVRVEPRQAPRKVAAKRVRGAPEPKTAQVRNEAARGAARVKSARGHGNPMDAQALDARVQVWPCKSGGICDWKR